MVCLVRRFFVAALVVVSSAAASGELVSAHQVTTVRGLLVVDKDRSGAERYPTPWVKLEGETLAEFETDWAFIFAVEPNAAAAELVLVITGGGNACEGWYRVVDLRGKGPVRISKEFTNCNALVGRVKHNPLRLEENPVYRDGAWHIALYSNSKTETEPMWYIYEDGEIRVTGPDALLRSYKDPVQQRFAVQLVHEVSTEKAKELIEKHGSPLEAYRAWLWEYTKENVRVDEFTKEEKRAR